VICWQSRGSSSWCEVLSACSCGAASATAGRWRDQAAAPVTRSPTPRGTHRGFWPTLKKLAWPKAPGVQPGRGCTGTARFGAPILRACTENMLNMFSKLWMECVRQMRCDGRFGATRWGRLRRAAPAEPAGPGEPAWNLPWNLHVHPVPAPSLTVLSHDSEFFSADRHVPCKPGHALSSSTASARVRPVPAAPHCPSGTARVALPEWHCPSGRVPFHLL